MKTSVRTPRSVMEARHKGPARKPSVSGFPRRYPIGAELLPTGGVHFRVWAPKCERVELQLSEGAEFSSAASTLLEMQREEHGHFSVSVPKASAGMRYR